MAIITLLEKQNEQAINDLISTCKSNSGVCGMKLRNAHQSLGNYLGLLIAEVNQEINHYAVIVLMRAGLPFGMGISDSLEICGKCVKVFFSTKEKEIPNDFLIEKYDKIILADAVVESGNSILELARKLSQSDKIIFATNVLSEKAVPKFERLNLYAIRVSQVSFKGSMQKNVSNGKGPDTGERLFNSHF